MPEPSPRSSLSEPHDVDELYQESSDEVYADAVDSVELVDAELAAVPRRLGPLFWIAVATLGVIVVAVVLANWLPLPDPDTSDVMAPEQGPSSDHWLGTDGSGRDVLSRVIHGGQVTLIIGFTSATFGLVLGGLGGLVAGYYRGRAETGILWLTDIGLSFPPILLALALAAFWGKDVFQIALILGIVSIWPIVRIARANTLVHSQREFVLAARALGASRRRILRREVMPNVLPAMLSFSLLVVAIVIIAEASLSVIGVAVPDRITWGQLIAEGSQNMDDAPWGLFAPCAALFLTVLSLNLAGDQLRAYFDVKEAGL